MVKPKNSTTAALPQQKVMNSPSMFVDPLGRGRTYKDGKYEFDPNGIFLDAQEYARFMRAMKVDPKVVSNSFFRRGDLMFKTVQSTDGHAYRYEVVVFGYNNYLIVGREVIK